MWPLKLEPIRLDSIQVPARPGVSFVEIMRGAVLCDG